MADGYDVAVVGAGDVGAAIARELARFELRVALLDRGDVGAGTSKANTAILHTGFDAKPGTHEALLAGVDMRRGEAVTAVEHVAPGWRLATARGALTARTLVNAAGLHSDELHRMAGYDGFTVTPRRGELLVFDKLSRPLVSHIVL